MTSTSPGTGPSLVFGPPIGTFSHVAFEPQWPVAAALMAVFDAAKDAIAAALRCDKAAAKQELPRASAPGETFVSDVVRSLARTSDGVSFEDSGEHALKAIEEPHRLYAVVLQEAPEPPS